MISTARQVPTNETVLSQVDFFQPDGYTRVAGIGFAQVVVQTFWQNVPQPWSVVTGAGVTDAQVVAGRIYWNEVPGASGYYSVRFRPNAAGYWRLSVGYPAGLQVVAQDFDVAPRLTTSTGLQSSTVKGC
jgi:hypothetical protein